MDSVIVVVGFFLSWKVVTVMFIAMWYILKEICHILKENIFYYISMQNI